MTPAGLEQQASVLVSLYGGKEQKVPPSLGVTSHLTEPRGALMDGSPCQLNKAYALTNVV